jgi:RNA polymerase sigma-70 factor (family 1)
LTSDIIHTDTLLFRQIAEGNEQAYTQIFHSFTPKLYSFLLKITRDEQLARELLQDTFLKLWQHRAELQRVEQPAAWLYKVASNTALQHLRQQTTRQRIQQAYNKEVTGSDNRTGESVLETKEMTTLLQQAVESLPEKRRQIYLMSRQQGMRHAEIAEQLHLSVQTVKNQLGTAITQIREHLRRETGLSLATIALLLSFT